MTDPVDPANPANDPYIFVDDDRIALVWPNEVRPASVRMSTDLFEAVVGDLNLMRRLIVKQGSVIHNWRLGKAPNSADYKDMLDLNKALLRNLQEKAVEGQ